jgi:hypothetical protein
MPGYRIQGGSVNEFDAHAFSIGNGKTELLTEFTGKYFLDNVGALEVEFAEHEKVAEGAVAANSACAFMRKPPRVTMKDLYR